MAGAPSTATPQDRRQIRKLRKLEFQFVGEGKARVYR
jgi:hypothetical protein